MKIPDRAAKKVLIGRPTQSAEPRGDTVQSLSRALMLLNTLAKSDQGLSLSEVAQRVELPISTTHRLLGTLQHENFVRYDPARGAWFIGVQAFIVGSAFLRSRELTAIARPLMHELMENSGETVNLAVEDAGEIVYIAQVECQQTMRAKARPGGRASMHASALGKALLAQKSECEVERIVGLRGLTKQTEKTITTPEKLREELAIIREQGYAVDDEENAVGLRCVAAAIFDEHEEAVAAISLSGPAVRVTGELVPKLGQAVHEAASQIACQFGGRRPSL